MSPAQKPLAWFEYNADATRTKGNGNSVSATMHYGPQTSVGGIAHATGNFLASGSTQNGKVVLHWSASGT